MRDLFVASVKLSFHQRRARFVTTALLALLANTLMQSPLVIARQRVTTWCRQ